MIYHDALVMWPIGHKYDLGGHKLVDHIIYDGITAKKYFKS